MYYQSYNDINVGELSSFEELLSVDRCCVAQVLVLYDVVYEGIPVLYDVVHEGMHVDESIEGIPVVGVKPV